MDYRIPAFVAIIIIVFVAMSLLYNLVNGPINVPQGKLMRATILKPIGMVGVGEVNDMNELIKNGTVAQTAAATASAIQAGIIMTGSSGCHWTCDPGYENVAGHCRNVCGTTLTPITSSSGEVISGGCSRNSDCPSGQTCQISLSTASASIGYCVSSSTAQSEGGEGAGVAASGFCNDMCTGYSWSTTIPTGEDDPYKCWSLNGWASPEGCCCGGHSTFIPSAGFGASGTFATREDLEKIQGGPFKGLPAETIAIYFSSDHGGNEGGSWKGGLVCTTDAHGCCSRECENGGSCGQSPWSSEECMHYCTPLPGFQHISAVCIVNHNCFCIQTGLGVTFPSGSSDLTCLNANAKHTCFDCVGETGSDCVWCPSSNRCLPGRTDGNYDCSVQIAYKNDDCFGYGAVENPTTTTTAPADTQAPFFSDQSESAIRVTPNDAVQLSIYWTDNVGLSTAILITNETGAWKATSFYGSPKRYDAGDTGGWSNFTWKNSSVPIGTLIGWGVEANDTSNNFNYSSTGLFGIVQTTTTSTTTASFSASNFACSAITGGFLCNLNYNNNLGENGILIFLFTDSNGNIIEAPAPTVNQGSGNTAVTFYCSVHPSGDYFVFWNAYRKSDASLSNRVVWSTTNERQKVTC